MSQMEIMTQESAAGEFRKGNEGQYEVRIARTSDEVESLRQVWSSWGGHRDSDIDVVLMVIDSYPEALRPHVIAIYRNGEPDAILIGRLEKKHIPFKIGYLTPFRPWARCLTFVYGALRGNASPENSEIFIREVQRCLKNGEADVAFLEYVHVDSALFQKAVSVPGFLSRDWFPASQLRDFMEVPDSMKKVYQRMSTRRGQTLRRRIKKLQSHPAGKLQFVRFSEPADMDQMFRDVDHIAKNTYQRGLGAGFSDTPEVRSRMGLAANKGWLRAYVEYLGDRPVSFWVGMLYSDVFVSEYLGFDTEFRPFAPGMVLILTVIEGFCNRTNGDEVKVLDFGLGHAEYKEVLATKTLIESGVFIFSPTFKGAVLNCMRAMTRIADLTARKALASTSGFSRVKRLWRDRLAKHAKSPSKAGSPDGASESGDK